MDPDRLKGGFDERRGGGTRAHEAVDILAPRYTPVHAVENGTIAKLFLSKAGGNTIYQFDPEPALLLLLRAPGTLRGGHPRRAERLASDVIGYVGTSGNAPPDTPHLHFAIFQLTPARHWWQGTADRSLSRVPPRAALALERVRHLHEDLTVERRELPRLVGGIVASSRSSP